MFLEVSLIFVCLLICWWLTSPDSEIRKYAALIPGPTSYPIVGNMFDVPLTGTAAFATLKKLWDEHGPVVRLWMGNKLLVLLFEAEDIEVVLKSTTQVEKGEVYKFFHPWIGTGVLTSTRTKWRARRKALTPTFHFKILEHFLDIFKQNGNILLDQLMTKVGKGYFDVHPFVVAYSLDIIYETAMGVKINAQTEETSEYRKAVEQMSQLISQRFNNPLLNNGLIYYLSGLKSKENRLVKALHEHTRQVVNMKSEELLKCEIQPEDDSTDLGIKRKIALLELALRLKHSSDPVFQSDIDVCEEVETFMFEGHDTSTAGLCFALDMLAAHPDYQERLYNEVSGSFVKDNCSPTMDQINDLKYLDMFLREVERFCPSVPFIARQLTENVQLKSGYTIPAETMLSFNIFRIHRNERWFPNPSVFNPDNFLQEVSAKRHPFAYIPFSAGPRNCIGQKFATLQLKMALIKLVLNLKFEKEPDFNVIFTSNLVLESANGHRMKVSKRD